MCQLRPNPYSSHTQNPRPGCQPRLPPLPQSSSPLFPQMVPSLHAATRRPLSGLHAWSHRQSGPGSRARSRSGARRGGGPGAWGTPGGRARSFRPLPEVAGPPEAEAAPGDAKGGCETSPKRGQGAWGETESEAQGMREHRGEKSETKGQRGVRPGRGSQGRGGQRRAGVHRRGGRRGSAALGAPAEPEILSWARPQSLSQVSVPMPVLGTQEDAHPGFVGPRSLGRRSRSRREREAGAACSRPC